MISTFMGLETAKRGLTTAQGALYTTGNNVSNANTPGYTRQRVNLVQTPSFPTPGLNSPKIAGQIGTGVATDTVQRIREIFLDAQYRTQNTNIGYYGSLSESLTKMEGIMNEPTDNGLQATMQKFWNSLQDLSANAENSAARDVVAASGQAVTDTLNYYYNSLKSVQKDIGSQVDVKQNDINSIISNIERINKSISEVEPNGYIPNDLYDERDQLVDSLSKFINIKVSNVIPTNYGNVSDVATGLYNIELIQGDGKSYSPPINLISVNQTGILGSSSIEVIYENSTEPKGMITGVKIGSTTMKDDLTFSGEFPALIESYGYKGKDATGTVVSKGIYPEMIENLNKMTAAFATEFNAIHQKGFALGEQPDAITGAKDSSKAIKFFDIDLTNPAQSIKVNDAILNNSTLIAAGKSSGASGDNGNAQLLADLKKKSFSDYTPSSVTGLTGLTGSFDSFYAGIIGKLGVDSQNAQKNSGNAKTLADSVNQNRQSVSSVSLDEEMTNMIKFQQAYNASARMVTLMDEMLDKIVNGMGTGGR